MGALANVCSHKTELEIFGAQVTVTSVFLHLVSIAHSLDSNTASYFLT